MLRVRLKADGRLVEILPDGSERAIPSDPRAIATAAHQAAYDVEPTHPWHLQIQEHKIRLVRRDLLQSRSAVGRLSDDLDAGDQFQFLAQYSSGDRLIVHDQRSQEHAWALVLRSF